MANRRLFRVACLALLVAPAPTWANSFDVFGMGVRGSAMGSASVSNADGYAAIYYNPAGMTQSPSSLGIGFMGSFDNASIRLAERPDGYDIPNLGSNTPAIPTELELRERRDLESVDSTMGIFLGATTDLGFDAIRIGLAAFIPVGSSPAQARFADERERLFSNQLQYDVVGRRLQHQIVLFSVAYKVIDWMSLGVGLSFMPSAPTDSAVYVPNLTDQNNVDINVKIDLLSRFRPNAGILFHPGERLRVGLAYRHSQALEITGRNEVQIRGLQEQEDYPFYQSLDIVLQFSPKQLVAGVSYLLDIVLLSLDVNLSLWSEYRGNHGEPANFSNTWSPRFGAEMALGEGDFLRVGAGFDPNPAPPQTGRSNYVDNDRIFFSVGSEHQVELFGSLLSVGWYFQMHFLLNKTEIKAPLDDYPDCADGVTSICDEVPDDSIDPDTGLPWPEARGLQTGNIGFPAFSSGGWIGAAGVELSWEF